MGNQSIRIIGSVAGKRMSETREVFMRRFLTMAEAMDDAGWWSALIFTNNNAQDPWLLAQLLLANTKNLRPLVAVQPLYTHPFVVSNSVATLTAIYERGVDLNFVAGDHPRDRMALCDPTPHDERYARLLDYATIVKKLLEQGRPISFRGKYYGVEQLHMTQWSQLCTGSELFMSGSSDAAMEVARQLAICTVRYPEPPEQCGRLQLNQGKRCGVRVGIIVRESATEAWEIANRRFPPTEEGAAVRDFTSSLSDAHWVKKLNTIAEETLREECYWLSPYRNNQSNCPYLVGSFEDVARALKLYVNAGYTDFFLDLSGDLEDARRISSLIANMDALSR